jgi:hypothetical protein
MQLGLMQSLLALALHHAPVSDKDQFRHLELVLKDSDLIGHRGRIPAVAFKDAHRQRFSLLIGQQADDNLQLAPLAVPVVPEGA